VADVRTLCLAVLAHGPASGYEIKKTLEEGPYAHFHQASFGSIYPALARLAAEGMVTARQQEQAKRPDKRVYRLTPAGKRVLAQALRGPVAEDYIRIPFLLPMFHADLVPPKRRLEMLDERLDHLRKLLAHMESKRVAEGEPCTYPGVGPEWCLGYGLALIRAEIAYLEQNRLAMAAAPAAAVA